jgi:LEA14-like dessication related protein
MSRLFCLLVFLLSACAGLGGLSQKPEVSLAGLDLVELGLFEQRFVMKLRIQNPNDVDLPINGLAFDVALNGQHFAKGLSPKPLIIPRMGEALLEVTATSNLGSVLRQIRELQKGGRDRIDYRMNGKLSLDGVGSIPFDRQGDLQMPLFDLLPKMPQIPPPIPPASTQERT